LGGSVAGADKPLLQPDRREVMSSIARVTEVISSSTVSIEDAVKQGVARAAQTLENVEGVWVQDIKASVKDGSITEWRVALKITFLLND
jgi:flavin-binding protein dodecin